MLGAGRPGALPAVHGAGLGLGHPEPLSPGELADLGRVDQCDAIENGYSARAEDSDCPARRLTSSPPVRIVVRCRILQKAVI